MSTPPAPDFDSFTITSHANRLRVMPRGQDRLDALFDLINGARRTLDCFWFLYQPDATGTRVRDALVAAARRGVTVRLHIDAFGSDAQPDFFDPLIEAGGTFARFAPRWDLRYLIRNHQKMAIADGARVMTGGFNISDHYFAPPSQNGWCDLGVEIEGPLVQRFADWFDCIHEWINQPGSQFRRMRRMVKKWDERVNGGGKAGSGPVQVLLGGPPPRSGRWARQFKQDLARGHRTDIVTAYFSPPRSYRRALRRAARFQQLRLIVARYSDFAATVDAARLHFARMVRAGVRLFEYQPSKLHMKLIVIDNVSYFGSGNLDMRSIRLNLEIMVRIEDQALADRLRELVDQLERASVPVDREWFASNGGWRRRIGWVWSSFMLRFVDYNLARSAAGD